MYPLIYKRKIIYIIQKHGRFSKTCPYLIVNYIGIIYLIYMTKRTWLIDSPKKNKVTRIIELLNYINEQQLFEKTKIVPL